MRILTWLAAASLGLMADCPGLAQAPEIAPKPLGQLVEVGGYRVHLYCIGSGGPTVVVTGAGYSFDWGLVQPEVAKFARICTYDHSGGVWSDPGPEDSCSLRVDEIHKALKNAGIAGPYVLVGHSLGALVSRLYAARYEAEVAGMVIVDHAGVLFVAPGTAPAALSPALPLAGGRVDPNAGFDKLSERDHRLHVWANSRPGAAQGMRRNVAMLPQCEAAVKAATQNRPTPLGDKPLIALSQPMAKQLHADLLPLSSNSKQQIAENSGHYVMIDRPDAVIAAINEVVTAARTHSKLKGKGAAVTLLQPTGEIAGVPPDASRRSSGSWQA